MIEGTILHTHDDNVLDAGVLWLRQSFHAPRRAQVWKSKSECSRGNASRFQEVTACE
jgi:hypothetical protein